MDYGCLSVGLIYSKMTEHFYCTSVPYQLDSWFFQREDGALELDVFMSPPVHSFHTSLLSFRSCSVSSLVRFYTFLPEPKHLSCRKRGRGPLEDIFKANYAESDITGALKVWP